MPTFRGKRFTDASLLSLAKIETIRQIALYDTLVTDEGLIAFAAKAKRLTVLHMSSELLTDRGLSAILAACPIDNLQIDHATGVTDAVAAGIAGHPQIRELYLNGTSIGDQGLKALEGMPNVWSFCADGSRISDAGLASLSTMPELCLISLNATRVRGHGLRELSELERSDIYLEDCRVSDEGLAMSLSRMTRMKTLSLSQTDVTDKGLESVGECRLLEDLRLDDTGITDATLDLLTDLPDLQVLYVERTGVTADRVARLKDSMDDLCVYSDFGDEE